MHSFRIEADDEKAAKAKLSAELGIPEPDLHLVQVRQRTFTLEAITLFPYVEVEISKDKMKVYLKRAKPHVGNDVPKLTTDYVLDFLKKKGVTFGIKSEVITEQLFKIISQPPDGSKVLNILIAEGEAPVPAQTGRPQWVLDLKVFNKDKPVFGRRGEVVAKAPLAVKGRPGMNVCGEPIPFPVEDSFRLPTGKGIVVEAKETETIYTLESSGELILDQGIRLRLESKVVETDEGLSAALKIDEKSFSGKKFTGQDLVEMAESAGLKFGVLSAKEIQNILDKTKKWPSLIPVAKGKEPVNGKAGKVEFPYRKASGAREVDKEKAERGIVFPGEAIAVVSFPSMPQDGMTVFGELLRGRIYNEQPIYPGRNVTRERRENQEVLLSTIYGKVKLEGDRVHVENILKISDDKMQVSLELFPQMALSSNDLVNLFREKDVLFGFEKEQLEAELQRVFQSGAKVTDLVVARGKPVKPGKNARLRYYFNPEDLKEKGLLVKSKAKSIFAAPGDLLLEKILPIDPVEGSNVYRERIEVPKNLLPVDVEVQANKYVSEKQVGAGTEQDPLRMEYRATTFGTLSWVNRQISITPAIEIDDKETSFKMWLCNRSDFGTAINFEVIQKFATEEGVRVELERKEIERALRTARPEDGSLIPVEIAKSIPAQNGEDAKIEYFVTFNEESVDAFLDGKSVPDPSFLDLVRPKDLVAQKTPAGSGVDGKSVFGRRVVAERGLDLPWQTGFGFSRSTDGNQLFVDSKSPGYVMIEDRRLVLVNPVNISPDRMTAKMKIYPSKSPRFQVKEDKIFDMIQAKGIQAGIKAEEIRRAINEAVATGTPQEVEVAKGIEPQVGRPAQYRIAFEVDQSSGAIREDGSIDYKAGTVYHMVKTGQLLMVKQEATRGADGFNVLGERLPGQMGEDVQVNPGEGVRLSQNNLEYIATRDGIVEFTGRAIRVIEGLLIPGNVDFSTGSIDSGPAKVMVRGSVLPGFQVQSESEVIIEKVAEACTLISGTSLYARGGFIGKDVGRMISKGKLEALYINSGATVECNGDLIVKNELLNSTVRTGGKLSCDGTIAGGEIWAYESVSTRVLGAAGSEQATKLYLGVNYMELQAAQKRIEDEGIPVKEADFKARLDEVEKRLREIYEQIPEASKTSQTEAQRLQDEYREWMEQKKECSRQMETLQKQKDVILNTVTRNKNFQVLVKDIIHPGVCFIYKDVVWELKEPIKSVMIQWNEGSSNFVSRRI